MDLELKGKLAVITGGSKGIGLGIARAFAREGADVIITARTPDAVEAAATAIAGEYAFGPVPSRPTFPPPRAAMRS